VGNLTEKVKAAHPLFEVRRCISLGCGLSLSGLRYSLRKPFVVESGERALSLMAGRAPDLAVLDLRLPDVPGADHIPHLTGQNR
jgi:CheY-like chemotaxis protein